MKRFFRLALSGLAMVVVALISALLAMRLAIHGSEVDVPNFTNLTIPEASELAIPKGLQLTLENRFYSLDMPAGRVLSQSPAAGSRVRRGWQVRVTESLGAQKVDIPNVVGQEEHGATVNIRRATLDLGSIAHIAISGDPNVVLAQTPPPNAEGVDRARVSLLLSEPEGASSGEAMVTPILTGLSGPAAIARASASGLRVVYGSAPAAPAPAQQAPNAAPAITSAAPSSGGNVVVGQFPAAGHRILRGEVVHITLGAGTASANP